MDISLCTKSPYNKISLCDNTSCEYKPFTFNENIQPSFKKYRNNIVDINCIDRANNYLEHDNKQNGCSEKTYYQKNDVRLMDIRRGNNIYPVSEPPIDGSLPFESDNYKTFYKDYKDIKSGQITYYVDKRIDGAFFDPVFINDTEITSYVYVTPMNVTKPYYNRQPSFQNDRNYGLSWFKDSQEQREDIISKQMNIINKNRYQSFKY